MEGDDTAEENDGLEQELKRTAKFGRMRSTEVRVARRIDAAEDAFAELQGILRKLIRAVSADGKESLTGYGAPSAGMTVVTSAACVEKVRTTVSAEGRELG